MTLRPFARGGEEGFSTLPFPRHSLEMLRGAVVVQRVRLRAGLKAASEKEEEEEGTGSVG